MNDRFNGCAEFRKNSGGMNPSTEWRLIKQGLIPPAEQITPNKKGRRPGVERFYFINPMTYPQRAQALKSKWDQNRSLQQQYADNFWAYMGAVGEGLGEQAA